MMVTKFSGAIVWANLWVIIDRNSTLPPHKHNPIAAAHTSGSVGGFLSSFTHQAVINPVIVRPKSSAMIMT
jgi:hypothetical protein